MLFFQLHTETSLELEKAMKDLNKKTGDSVTTLNGICF